MKRRAPSDKRINAVEDPRRDVLVRIPIDLVVYGLFRDQFLPNCYWTRDFAISPGNSREKETIAIPNHLGCCRVREPVLTGL